MEELSDLQKSFLNSGDITSSEWAHQRRALEALHKYEYEKQTIELDGKEFEKIVKIIISRSEIVSAKHRLMYIRKYFEWINANYKKIKFNYNSILKNMEDSLEDILNPIFFSREEIYDFVKQHEDPQLSMTLLLLFEGIKGNSYDTEILSMKRQDIVNNSVSITNRKIVFPEDIMPIIDKGYRFEFGKSNFKYFMNEYLIHNAGKNDIKDRKHWRTVNNRLDRLKKEKPGLGLVAIEDSGMSFYLSLIEKIKNEDLSNEDYYKVLKRYGKYTDEIDRLKRKYKLYKKSDKYNSNIDVSKFERVFRNIMDNEYEVNEQTEINRELGKLGEEFMFQSLKKEYGENVVDDMTKYGVGYDFLVKDGNLKYEVKSTGILEDECKIYMTIGELRQAFSMRDKYILAILSFAKDAVIQKFKIKNPIHELNLVSQVSKIIEIASDDIIVPLQLKIKINTNILESKIVYKWKE